VKHILPPFLILILFLAGLEKANAFSLVLSWSASESPDVAGYDVYYGTNSGNYPYSINVGDATSVTITNLIPGETYYFVATAYDAAGDQSADSTPISFTVPVTLAVALGAGQGSPGVLQFQVASGHSYVVQASTDLMHWSSIWQSGVMAADGVAKYADPNAGSFASRFYRLVQN
jgi:hypothetical protein